MGRGFDDGLGKALCGCMSLAVMLSFAVFLLIATRNVILRMI